MSARVLLVSTAVPILESVRSRLQLVELVRVQALQAVLQQRQQGIRKRLVGRVLAVVRHTQFRTITTFAQVE